MTHGPWRGTVCPLPYRHHPTPQHTAHPPTPHPCFFYLTQVIVVEDENGNIVRETMKDTDVLARYKAMHETLVYLSHLGEGVAWWWWWVV